MKIILAPDKFKGSLSAEEVCNAMANGIRKTLPGAQILSIPLADGGEGTVEALVAATHGRFEAADVAGPLNETVQAKFGVLGDGKTAVMEMAQASGLWRVPTQLRNPLKTTTYGTGQMILAALKLGCKNLIVGIGGSATTDCGTGMAQALGVRFYNKAGQLIQTPMTGALMGDVSRVDLSQIPQNVRDCQITVACDVTNPLLGATGATRVYSPQKGANPQQLDQLENNMTHVIDVIEAETGRKVRDLPGAGAAGGLGAGFLAFFNAKTKPGIDIVMDTVRFQDQIRGANLILTGEGRVDDQTVFGKTISGVLKAAKTEKIPVIVLAGSVEPGAEALYDQGVASIFSICTKPMTLEEAMKNAAPLLETTADRVMRLLSTR